MSLLALALVLGVGWREAAGQVTASLATDLPSPQPAGTTITWTATAAGGVSPYAYKWWQSADGGATWTVAGDWSPSATFVWTPPAAGTGYRIGVWARTAGSAMTTTESRRRMRE